MVARAVCVLFFVIAGCGDELGCAITSPGRDALGCAITGGRAAAQPVTVRIVGRANGVTGLRGWSRASSKPRRRDAARGCAGEAQVDRASAMARSARSIRSPSVVPSLGRAAATKRSASST